MPCQWFAAADKASATPTLQRAANVLRELHATFEHVRRALREMSAAAEVPVEPQEQRELLDITMQLPGVVMAGVPGGKVCQACVPVLTGVDLSSWWPRRHLCHSTR